MRVARNPNAHFNLLRGEDGNYILDADGNLVYAFYVGFEGAQIGLGMCPFCGELPDIKRRGNSVSYYVVYCEDCRAEVKGTTALEAANSWNKRKHYGTRRH